jgi:hypothetical protein
MNDNALSRYMEGLTALAGEIWNRKDLWIVDFYRFEVASHIVY